MLIDLTPVEIKLAAAGESLSKRHLEIIASFQQQNKPPHPTPAQFLLAHGSIMLMSGKLPRKRGIPKQCYDNAYRMARRSKKLRYAEGMALSVIPVEHAWCIDEDSRVIDPTWGDDYPDDYFGMTVDLEIVRKVRKMTKCWSVLWDFWHWPEVYPLLKEAQK